MGCHLIIVSRCPTSNRIFSSPVSEYSLVSFSSVFILFTSNRVFLPHFSGHMPVSFLSHFVSSAIGTSRLTPPSSCPSHPRLSLSHQKSDFLISSWRTQFCVILVSLSHQLSRLLVFRLVRILMRREKPLKRIGSPSNYFVRTKKNALSRVFFAISRRYGWISAKKKTCFCAF